MAAMADPHTTDAVKPTPPTLVVGCVAIVGLVLGTYQLVCRGVHRVRLGERPIWIEVHKRYLCGDNRRVKADASASVVAERYTREVAQDCPGLKPWPAPATGQLSPHRRDRARARGPPPGTRPSHAAGPACGATPRTTGRREECVLRSTWIPVDHPHVVHSDPHEDGDGQPAGRTAPGIWARGCGTRRRGQVADAGLLRHALPVSELLEGTAARRARGVGLFRRRCWCLVIRNARVHTTRAGRRRRKRKGGGDDAICATVHLFAQIPLKADSKPL